MDGGLCRVFSSVHTCKYRVSWGKGSEGVWVRIRQNFSCDPHLSDVLFSTHYGDRRQGPPPAALLPCDSTTLPLVPKT